jgi:hypothetical protein
MASLKWRERALARWNPPLLPWSWGRDGENNSKNVGGAGDIRHIGKEGPVLHKLIVSDSLFSPYKQVQDKNPNTNFEVGSAMHGLCKLQSTEAQIGSPQRSSEGGR